MNTLLLEFELNFDAISCKRHAHFVIAFTALPTNIFTLEHCLASCLFLVCISLGFRLFKTHFTFVVSIALFLTPFFHSNRPQTTSNTPFQVDDVVKDTPLPEFKLNLDFLFHLLAPRRKLRPAKRPVKVLAAHPDRCEIAIYVQKAHNVPVRKDAAHRGGVYAQQGGGGGGRRGELMTPQAR
jgi:hypothetical protein